MITDMSELRMDRRMKVQIADPCRKAVNWVVPKKSLGDVEVSHLPTSPKWALH